MSLIATSGLKAGWVSKHILNIYTTKIEMCKFPKVIALLSRFSCNFNEKIKPHLIPPQLICNQTPRFTIGDCAAGHRADNRDKNRNVLIVPRESRKYCRQKYFIESKYFQRTTSGRTSRHSRATTAQIISTLFLSM